MSAESEPEHHRFQGSSAVDEAWWDPETDDLTVLFSSGRRWRYFMVKPSTWASFQTAGSPGRFVIDELNTHPNRRIA